MEDLPFFNVVVLPGTMGQCNICWDENVEMFNPSWCDDRHVACKECIERLTTCHWCRKSKPVDLELKTIYTNTTYHTPHDLERVNSFLHRRALRYGSHHIGWTWSTSDDVQPVYLRMREALESSDALRRNENTITYRGFQNTLTGRRLGAMMTSRNTLTDKRLSAMMKTPRRYGRQCIDITDPRTLRALGG